MKDTREDWEGHITKILLSTMFLRSSTNNEKESIRYLFRHQMLPNPSNPCTALTWESTYKGKRSRGLTKGDMEENCRRREAEDWLCHLEWSYHCCERLCRLEETRKWPYSPRGEQGTKRKDSVSIPVSWKLPGRVSLSQTPASEYLNS